LKHANDAMQIRTGEGNNRRRTKRGGLGSQELYVFLTGPACKGSRLLVLAVSLQKELNKVGKNVGEREKGPKKQTVSPNLMTIKREWSGVADGKYGSKHRSAVRNRGTWNRPLVEFHG